MTTTVDVALFLFCAGYLAVFGYILGLIVSILTGPTPVAWGALTVAGLGLMLTSPVMLAMGLGYLLMDHLVGRYGGYMPDDERTFR